MRQTIQLVLPFAILLAMSGCGFVPVAGSDAERLVSGTGAVDWNRYYTNAETNRIMRDFAQLHPELTRVFSIGRSYLGADLMMMEISNRRTGPAAEKPAIYVDGGLHARELASSAVALYFMAHLLNNYGIDSAVTKLVDTRTFYIRPKFNPDGSDLVLREDQFLRSSVRPIDEDGDGIADNDPPEDLDGDGRILMMRVPDPDGNMRIGEVDPRIMVRRQPGDAGPFYRMIREGTDRNNSGVINSDGIGGIDMNRNYPRGWEPEHMQPGAGPFPMSEPEVYATVRFLSEHRNVFMIIHGHTSGGFVYRLPSAMDPSDMPPTDEALIIRLGEYYTRSTGRPVRPSATHATERRYGTLIGWAYWDGGIIGWVPEYSPPPEAWVPDFDGDGQITEVDWHRLNDERFGGRYFSNWRPFDHPQLGPIEIGGWHTLFWGQNPPAELLERELEVQVPWFLYLAGQAPVLELAPPQVESLDSDRYRLHISVTNAGYLPTSVTDRGHVGRHAGAGRMLHQLVEPPLVILEVEGAEIEGSNGRVRIQHLAGSTPFLQAAPARSASVSFVVRRTARNASFRVIVESPKAGTIRSDRIPLVPRADS
jgi:hypothetical protein